MNKDARDESSDRIDEIIDRFTKAIRSGNTPSLSSFVNEFPDLESEIRELLPLVSMVEGAGKDSADHSQPERERLPPKIDGYRIIQEIGRGGMGVVYEAEQLSPRRRVAIKVLSFSTDRLARERFRREADSAAQLQHANVIPVFEVGQTAADVIYYSMQLIEGFALDQIRDQLSSFRSTAPNRNSLSDIARSLIDTRRVNASNGSSLQLRRSFVQIDSRSKEQEASTYYHNVAAIIAQVAEAVDYSHAKGIIHRDIKPSNVLIDKTGQVWVSDFGLAKFEDDDLTRTGDIVGSVRYMSPERFEGKCDERADIYSLGVTLYELLTLQPPFSSPDKLQIIQQICSRDPIAPSVIDRRIPIDLETIVLKAMSKEPERRYSTAGELAQDLMRFVGDLPIRARRMSRFEKTLRWASRNRTLAASLLLTTVACVLSIVGLSLLASTRETARRNESVMRGREESARLSAEAEALANQQNLYFANINLAARSLETAGGVVRTRKTVREWNPMDHPLLDIGWEWSFLASKVDPELLVIRGKKNICWHDWNRDIDNPKLSFVDGNRVTVIDLPKGSESFNRRLNFSPSCGMWLGPNELAIGGESGQIQRIRLDIDAIEPCLKLSHKITEMRLNAKQTQVAISAHRKLYVINLNEGQFSEPREILDFRGFGRLEFSWHPHEDKLAAMRSARDFVVLDTNEKGSCMTRPTGLTHTIRWSHDGSKILTGGSNGTVSVFDVVGGSVERSLKLHRHYVQAIALANQSHRMTSAGSDRTVAIWDLASSKPQANLFGAEDSIVQLRISKCDQWVSAIGSDNSLRVWNFPSSAEIASYKLQTWGDCQHAIAIHPANSRVSAVEGKSKIVSFTKEHDLQQASNVYRRSLEQELQDGYISALAWTPQGDRLLWSSHKDFGWFEINKEASEEPTSMKADFQIASFGISPDSNRVARGGSEGFDILDMQSRKVIFHHRIDGARIKAIEFTPDGNWIVAGGYGALRVYQVDPSKLVRRIETTGITTRVSFSPDGKTLAVSSGSGVVYLVDFLSGKQIGTLEGHSQGVFSVDWHPGGKRIASGGSDGTVRIWDAKSRREVLAFRAEPTPVLSVEWSNDGQSLVSVTAEGEIAIRHAALKQLAPSHSSSL